MFKLPLNKYTALVIILIVLIVCYLGYNARNSVKKIIPGKSGKTNSKSKSKSGKSGKKSGKKAKSKSKNSETVDDSDNEEEERDAVEKDAEELFNLVHDGLCNNMQKEEFEEIAGDLADGFVFIELKQIYNQAIQRKMDPSNSITVEDYIKVLKKESDV